MEEKGNKEFRQFLSIASGSCLEVQSQASRALDYDFITEEEFKALYELSNEIYFRIGKFSEYLSQTEYKGSKYLT
jgi:four helix bundle protein